MAALWITSLVIIERCSAMALMFNASAAVHSDASIGSENMENRSTFRGTAQLDQAGRVARAAWAARYAEAAVLQAQRTAAEAEENAVAKAAEYVKSRIEAKAEADKLVSLVGTSASKLVEVSENQMACQGWCSSAEHADKPWEKKCRWKDCKGCSTCTDMLLRQSATGTVSKKSIVNSVISAVTHFAGNDKTNLDGLVSELEALSGAPAEKQKRCDDSCSSQWVKGMNLQEQQSFKSWEARCTWKGCDGCKQCGNGAAARQASAVTEKRCEDSCSSQWVKGMTLEEQQSVKSWEARCAWKDCDGCKQCVHGA